MGNCFQKSETNINTHKKSLVEIVPSDESPLQTQLAPKKPSPPTVILYADASNPTTHFLRFALAYKPLLLRFIPTPITQQFTVRIESEDMVSGPFETILDYIEAKLPHPPYQRKARAEHESTPFWVVVRLIVMQHRSMRWHLDRVVRWGFDMATRGGVGAVDPKVGTPKMEVSKLGKSYAMLLEMLLEHAQMEERVVFPLLQASDPGTCRCVNEEHARDLPIMNGIKEDIKSVAVIDVGTSTHREALHSLSARLQTLQKNCGQHFDEEEKNLLPLMEAVDSSQSYQRKVVEQCINVMQATHSHLLRFFIEGLLPHEAVEYLELLISGLDKDTMSSMLRLLVD